MSKLKNIIKRITQPFLKTGLAYYYRKPRKYNYQDIEVLVHPEVFPPHLTLSTKILLDFIVELDLKNKAFLELGCGSGIISLLASRKGAFVTATDINNIALDYLKKASFENQLKIDVINSDLFKNLKNYLKIIFVTGDKRGFNISKKRIVDDMGMELNLVSTTQRINWFQEHYDLDKIIYMGDGIFDHYVI